jgi:hypothetical protein
MSDTDATPAATANIDFELYRYTPSLPAAVVFVTVFAVLSALHTWRIQRHRAFYFTAFAIGGYCMDSQSTLAAQGISPSVPAAVN